MYLSLYLLTLPYLTSAATLIPTTSVQFDKEGGIITEEKESPDYRKTEEKRNKQQKGEEENEKEQIKIPNSLQNPVGSIRGSPKLGRGNIPPGVEVSMGGAEFNILQEQKEIPHTEHEKAGSDTSKSDNIQSDTNTDEYKNSDTNQTEKEASSYYQESRYNYGNEYGDTEIRYGDYGGGQGYGYNGGYGGGYPNYCPNQCKSSIRHSEKCKAWFGDCNRYLGWCGSRHQPSEQKGYGGYNKKLQKDHKSSMMTTPQDHEDVTAAKQDPFPKQANETSAQTHSQTNFTKEASYGDGSGRYDEYGGGGYEYGHGGYEYCPHRCMRSILHAKKCKTYYPSCNRHFGWCGGIHYGGGYFDNYDVGGAHGHGYEYGYAGGYDGDKSDYLGYNNNDLNQYPYQNYHRTRDSNRGSDADFNANIYKSSTNGDYRSDFVDYNAPNRNGNTNAYQTNANGDGDILFTRAQKTAEGDVDKDDDHERKTI